MRNIDEIIVHCSDTPKTMDIGADTIREWHVNERGWSDIGYHYVIKRDGTVENGRDLDGDGNVDEEVGAHVFGHNKNSIGICLVGGKPRANFTMKQYSALFQLVYRLRNEYGHLSVKGHYQYDSGKECPMFDPVALLGE